MYTERILTAASILLFYKSMLCLCLYQKNHLKLSTCSYFFFWWSCHRQHSQVPLGTDCVHIMRVSMVSIETTASNLPQSTKSQTSQILCVQPLYTSTSSTLTGPLPTSYGQPSPVSRSTQGALPQTGQPQKELNNQVANFRIWKAIQEDKREPLTHLV